MNTHISQRILRLLLAVAFLAGVSNGTSAQRQRGPRVGVRVDTGVVKVGGQVTLTVFAENAADAELLSVPEISGMELGKVYGPSRSQQISILNGRRSVHTSTRWTIALRALGAGVVDIPPFAIKVGGKRMQTRPQQLKVVEDLKGNELGFFEVVEAPEKVYDGLPFTLSIKFGFDAALKVSKAGLYLPWWDELPGVLVLDDPPTQVGAQRIELGLNSSGSVIVEEAANEKRDGREFRIFWLRKVLMPTRSGTLEFGTSYFEFQKLIRRGQRRFFGSDPDRTESFYIRADPFEIVVEALPEEGRPYDFTGAVGSFQVNRNVDNRDVDVGDSIKFSVEWSGEGNLEWFEPPDLRRLDGWEGFRYYGMTERNRIGSRRVTYDIAPKSPDIHEIPALPLWVLDPSSGEYEVLATEPVPIRVRAKETSDLGGEEMGREIGIDIRDIESEPVLGEDLVRPGLRTVGLFGLGLPLLWLAARVFVRRHGDPDSIEARRRRAAKRRFARELSSAQSASEQVHALDSFLSARSAERPEAWLGRDVRRWALEVKPELDAEAVEELAVLRDRLDEAVYAGGGDPLESSSLAGVAKRIVQGGL